MADSPKSPMTISQNPKKGDTVVIAMDGSEYSDYALQFYMESLHKKDDTVVLAHCAEYKSLTSPGITPMSGDASYTMVREEIEREETKITALIDKLTSKLTALHINGHIERIHGDPGPEICKLADSKVATYIVVGCRGKGSVRRTLTGSVTDYITHHSHVPVLISRHKDHMKHYHGIHFRNPLKKHSHDHHHETGDVH